MYIQLNTDFQRTAQRDERAFFNEQCIKLEENNKSGKTRDLFRKIGDIKGIFCPKMDTIKDINGRDLVDAKEIKKRWKEYTEELYKKDPNEPHSMVHHTEPEVLESEVKRALGSTAVIKASGCDRIPLELSKTLKKDAIKLLYSICHKSGTPSNGHRTGKGQILIPIPKKHSTKECANRQTVALISHASMVMLKILHARLQHYANQELPEI